MYCETVKTPTKCSHNFWEIKVNKKPDIIFACCTLYICNKISVGKPLVYISDIWLLWLPFNASCKQNINLTEVFYVKFPV